MIMALMRRLSRRRDENVGAFDLDVVDCQWLHWGQVDDLTSLHIESAAVAGAHQLLTVQIASERGHSAWVQSSDRA